MRRAKRNKSQVKTVPLNKHPSFPAPSSSSNSSFLNNSSSFLTLPRNTRKNGGPVVPTYDGTGSKEISIIGQLRNSFVTLRLKVCFPIHKCYRPQLTALDWWNEIRKFTNSNTKLEFHLKCMQSSKMDEKCKYSDTFTVQAPELQRTDSPDVSATKGSRGHQTCRWTSCRCPHRRCSPPPQHHQNIQPPINLSTSVALSVRDRRNTRG